MEDEYSLFGDENMLRAFTDQSMLAEEEQFFLDCEEYKNEVR